MQCLWDGPSFLRTHDGWVTEVHIPRKMTRTPSDSGDPVTGMLKTQNTTNMPLQVRKINYTT